MGPRLPKPVELCVGRCFVVADNLGPLSSRLGQIDQSEAAKRQRARFQGCQRFWVWSEHELVPRIFSGSHRPHSATAHCPLPTGMVVLSTAALGAHSLLMCSTLLRTVSPRLQQLFFNVFSLFILFILFILIFYHG